jgi:hypothetical protein
MWTSENASSETVWKIGVSPESRLRKLLNWVEGGRSSLLLPPKEVGSRSFELFSKQFLQALG